MKDSINISVDVNFIESQSDIASNQFVFSYTVKITNNGEIGANFSHVIGWLKMSLEKSKMW